MSQQHLFWLKTIALLAALGIVVAGSFQEIEHWWTVPLFLAIGYLIGKVTCSQHVRNYGLWITLAIFIALNGLHSMIDGIVFTSSETGSGILAIILHELVRQPILYVIIWGLLLPFSQSKTSKVILSLFAVTGIWIIGAIIGRDVGSTLSKIPGIHSYLSAAMFLLAGDIIHHLADEYAALHKNLAHHDH